MQKFIIILDSENLSLLADSAAECFVIPASADRGFIAAALAEAAKAEKIILLSGEGAAALCRELNADGVMLDVSGAERYKSLIAETRAQMGKQKFLGVISRNRRHEAMIVSEMEPDFVAFSAWSEGQEKIRDLVSWYNQLFLIQSAILVKDQNLDFSGFDCDIVILSAADYKIFVAKKQSLD